MTVLQGLAVTITLASAAGLVVNYFKPVKEKVEQELDTTPTRLESRYFEQQVYDAQQVEIEAERRRSIAAAEAYIKQGVPKFQ